MSFANDTPVGRPGGSRPIDQFMIGDPVLAAAANGQSWAWSLEPVQFSAGDGAGGGAGGGPAMAFVAFGEGQRLIVTPNQPMLVTGGKLARADELVPGSDSLVAVDGSAVPVHEVAIGRYQGGVHAIATKDAAGWNGRLDGHLLDCAGVICGDYTLETFQHDPRMAQFRRPPRTTPSADPGDAAPLASAAPTSFSEAISRAPLRAFSVVTFAVCMLVLIADGMDAQLLGIVAPIVIEEYGVDRGTFGIAVMAALIGFGLGSWGGGWLGDKIGRRWSLAIGTVIFSAATMGASLADDVWQMAAWRLVSGLGFGAAYSTAITLTGDWLPDRWRSVGVTTISVGTPAGGTVVGALAPTLVEEFGWRGTFLTIGAGTMLMVVLIVLVLRESPSYLLTKGKTGAAHAVAAKVLDGEFELAAERHTTDDSGGTIGVFHPSNLRLNLGVGIAFAAAAMVAYAMLNWGTTFLTAKGFPFEEASYAVSIGGITSMAASILAGLLVHRFGSRAVFLAIAAGLMLTLIALALKMETMANAPGWNERLLVISLYGLAAALFSAAIASMYAVMTYAFPSACRSAGIGFGIFVARVGAIAGSGLGGTLIDMGKGSLLPYFGTLIAVSALVFAAPLIIDRHVPPARSRL